MKHTILTLACIAIALTDAFGQATLPTIMLRPGEAWCKANGYYKTVDNQGITKVIIDEESALNNMKMLQSITELEAILKDEGFKTANLRSQTEAIDEFAAEEMLMTDEYGNGMEKDALDLARERAKADIYLYINWEIETTGPKKQLSYTLVGKDAYTQDDVCSVTGIGEPSISASEAILLREAVIGKLPEMKDRLANYMASILENGRAVRLKISKSTASTVHLETTVQGGTLDRVIYKWILANAVQHRAEKISSTRNQANYTANIALYDNDGLPMSAEDFLWQLSDYLAASPYNISTTVKMQGLGQAILWINGKQ